MRKFSTSSLVSAVAVVTWSKGEIDFQKVSGNFDVPFRVSFLDTLLNPLLLCMIQRLGFIVPGLLYLWHLLLTFPLHFPEKIVPSMSKMWSMGIFVPACITTTRSKVSIFFAAY